MIDKELQYFIHQINESADYFNNWLKQEDQKDIYSEKLNCLSYLDGDYKHNCLPCNLYEGAIIIREFLDTNRNCNFKKYFIKLYTILFYLQAEKCAVIYKKLGYVQVNNKNEFNWFEFPALNKIRLWANFFKHPKASFFMHHASIYIESFDDNPNFGFDGYINFQFLNEFYNGKTKNDELEKKLTNKQYYIFYPDLIQFTKDLTIEFETQLNIMVQEKNKVILQEFRKSTF